jgi:signal transduction histidine kinase
MTVMSILLGNLIDNAIKFSPQGGKIEVNIIKENNHVLWTITDQGPAIKPALQQRVFDRFYRITGNDTNGSGLGLAIAQQCASILYVEISIHNASAHGGRVVEIRFRESRDHSA